MARPRQSWEALRASVLARHTRPAAKPRLVHDRTAIVLGLNEGGVPIILPEGPRLQHAHVIGSIGSDPNSPAHTVGSSHERRHDHPYDASHHRKRRRPAQNLEPVTDGELAHDSSTRGHDH